MNCTWLRRWSVGCALSGAIACTGTPVTEPPSVAPPELPNVNAAETVPAFQGASDAAVGVGISGARGTVAPDSLVWLINLDGAAAPVLFRADADGSFAVPLQAREGDELRMHVLVDEVASPPLDMILGESFLLASPDHGTCVRTMPTQVDAGESPVGESNVTTLQIQNTCDGAIELDVSLHPSATDFRLGQVGETSLAQGESTNVSITFEPLAGESAVRSTVALLDIMRGTESDRIAVSLWGHVP